MTKAEEFVLEYMKAMDTLSTIPLGALTMERVANVMNQLTIKAVIAKRQIENNQREEQKCLI